MTVRLGAAHLCCDRRLSSGIAKWLPAPPQAIVPLFIRHYRGRRQRGLRHRLAPVRGPQGLGPHRRGRRGGHRQGAVSLLKEATVDWHLQRLSICYCLFRVTGGDHACARAGPASERVRLEAQD